ncbi:MAG: restriction endonuclease [Terrestrivirus sp.]|uniref:Restriction endonuclease n=1 Tax=Terrestrivirus sp. TaxID=2487775 RepID=A0A3G4ZJY7_9VIRU|nr:MAG: restriction endonuclease [Terrestrivirus sp.]
MCKPRDFTKNSHTVCYFDCNKCNHTFQTQLSCVTYRNHWCPYCANIKLCNDSICDYCIKKSFKSHPKSKYWSDKNGVTPDKVFKSAHSKFIFNCDKCPHEFLIRLNDLSQQNCWCPHCANKSFCQKDFCVDCYKKSFATHYRSKYWSIRNGILPHKVFLNTNSKFFFNCKDCKNEFEASVNDISQHDSWCPHCVNKTETKLLTILKNYYPSIICQTKFEWCKNKETQNFLPFDFTINEFRIIIELDGIQHFEQIGKWKSPDEIHKRDVYKMNCANKHNWSIIRLLQEDVLYDKYDWLTELIENINKIKVDEKIQNIYMAKTNIYDIFSDVVIN